MIKIKLNFWKRQTGKTTAILKKAKKDDLIVMHNNNCIQHILRKYHILKCKNIISINSICEGIRGRKVDMILLDEFDFFPIDKQKELLQTIYPMARNVVGYSTETKNLKFRKELKKLVKKYKNKLSEEDLMSLVDIIGPLFYAATDIKIKK